jgi:DNA-binding MarR family transcriptional regulator
MVKSADVDLTACAAGTLRRASRSLTRLYDAHLSRVGLTTTQFSILRNIERHGARVALSEMADELVFERTSLYRALLPLRRSRLVALRAGGDRRAKEVTLTVRGAKKIATALPHWSTAQAAILHELGPATWQDLAGRIGHLTAIARAASTP